MKKLLFLFSALLFISCSGDDDSKDLAVDDNDSFIPLSERLASMTSDEELFIITVENGLGLAKFMHNEVMSQNRIFLTTPNPCITNWRKDIDRIDETEIITDTADSLIYLGYNSLEGSGQPLSKMQVGLFFDENTNTLLKKVGEDFAVVIEFKVISEEQLSLYRTALSYESCD